mgnify:FL=1
MPIVGYGYDFEFVSQDQGNDEFYQCRGEVMYDDDHDETPEPELWDAALKLESKLIADGEKACASHSEKGWVEVQILNSDYLQKYLEM